MTVTAEAAIWAAQPWYKQIIVGHLFLLLFALLVFGEVTHVERSRSVASQIALHPPFSPPDP